MSHGDFQTIARFDAKRAVPQRSDDGHARSNALFVSVVVSEAYENSARQFSETGDNQRRNQIPRDEDYSALVSVKQ